MANKIYVGQEGAQKLYRRVKALSANYATAEQGAKADAAYQKPVDGIPKSDLDSGVQASLDKADTALQKHQDISGKVDKVSPATEGNLASLDATGNLVDSGVASGVLASKAAADGGTDLSLVTTGEKYVWNDWTSAIVDIPPINGVKIGGRKYEVKKFGNQVWMMESLKYDTDVSESVFIVNGIYHYKADYVFHNAEFATLIPSGWRIPTIADRNALVSLAGGQTVNGANYLKNNFNVEPSTMYNGYGNYPGSNAGWQFAVMTVGNGPIGGILISDGSLLNSNNVGGAGYGVSIPLRLCRDALQGE